MWKHRSIFQFSNVLGNLAAYLILPHVSKELLFAIFSTVGAAGVTTLLFLRRIPSQSHRPTYLPISSQTANLRASGRSKEEGLNEVLQRFKTGAEVVYSSIWRDVVVLFPNPRILMLCPMFFWTGFELAFWTGEFPQLLQASTIGLVLMFAGIAEVVGGLAMGWLSDCFGRSSAVLVGAIFYGTGLLLASFLKNNDWVTPTLLDAPLSSFIAAVCFGMGDSAFNTQTYAALGHLFPDPERKSLGAFTIFQFVQNVGSAVGFFYAIALPLHGSSGSLWQTWIQIGVLGLASVLFVGVDRIWLCHK